MHWTQLFFSYLVSFDVVLAKDNHGPKTKGKPNIVFIFTDDQDLHLDSIKYQKALQSELIAKGTSFSNHYVTTAQCCPSRASLLRGQASHNTNITHVEAPGGNYAKWVVAGEDNDYLPLWMSKAGYRNEYLGKLLNGVDIKNYSPAPKHWDHVDTLLEPYLTLYNTVVMSKDGEKPVHYPGWHQTDDKPFMLTIAPTAPHDESMNGGYPVPEQRHMDQYTTIKAPRTPNYNPKDDVQQAQMPSYIKDIKYLNASQQASGDVHYRARIQALLGVDEIVEDVVKKLTEKGILDNTYIVYTSDNGYHIGQHRVLGGKSMPYREDTNMPFYVRGPGIKAGATSKLPGTHFDLAPTFLEIAGLPKKDWPPFFDGSSLLDHWKNPSKPADKHSDSREIINVEFWGYSITEAVPYTSFNTDNSYKTLRIVTEGNSWLYSQWCTDDEEMYDTTVDPWELKNLAAPIYATKSSERVRTRLNALLMVTKSCAGDSCRNPWMYLQPKGKTINNLKEALDPKYDEFFKGIPKVRFEECIQYQSTINEAPYYPASSISLGSDYRKSTDNFVSVKIKELRIKSNDPFASTEAQRNASYKELSKSERYPGRRFYISNFL
ncbi:arylsulfatase [Fusarium flagelliforme]|uniref:Arylsulfatase n=1 Tax=Fusarium flagelliforme TaxID=2675880 RepID=A0A395M626_9HYPO|nr:arylsulfatase [Fusarium flagelliforme]